MEFYDDEESAPPAPKRKAGFFSKIGGGALMFAALIHVIGLIAGGFWIFQITREPEKKVDFMPPGGGGGERGAEHQVQQKKRAQITPTANAKRVFAEGATASYAIPEQGDNFGEMSTLSSLSGGGASGGLGGSGSGSGFGKGAGMGNGLAGSVGNGKISPFGMTDPNANALEGNFYDLKQTRGKRPTDISNEGVHEVIREFVSRGWRQESLSKYYKASQTLYQNRILMPLMEAEKAPEAFGCANEVKDSRWLVVYHGVVSPPKSGRYRFVGAGDDILMVRFNGKTVLDHGYVSGTTGVMIFRNTDFFKGISKNDELKRRIGRNYPMPMPMINYTYDSIEVWNSALGGLAVGPEFVAEEGKPYTIEILVSEIPGVLFGASLLIEEIGATYQKASTGSPILPLFRLDSSLPDSKSEAQKPRIGQRPPYDPNGPVWKKVSGRGKLDI